MAKILAVLLLAALGPAQSAVRRDTDAVRAGLRGAVRTVLTERVERGAGAGRAVPVLRETYDGAGNLVERVEYVRGDVAVTTEMRYDEAGNRVERTHRSGGPARTRLRPKVLTRPEPVVDAGGAEVSYLARTFNTAGRLTSETRFYGEAAGVGAQPVERTQLRYTPAGQLAETIRSVGSPLRQVERRVFTYDAGGRPTESILYGPNFQNPQKSTYGDTLDAEGNWVERTELRGAGEEAEQIFWRRTITYLEGR